MFQNFADLITYNLLNLTADTRLAESVNFFIYDVIKILALIFAVVSLIGFVKTYVNPKKFKESMSKARFGTGYLAAAIFGAISPFCSCSSIPLFIGFIKARIPLGIAFSFLITSPLVNEVAFVIMGGLFGWRLAFLYAISGIILGILGGYILGLMKMEKHIILEKVEAKEIDAKTLPKKFNEKLKYAIREGKKTFLKIYPYVLGGVFIGSLIHGYVPQDFFTEHIGNYKLLSVPIAVIFGIPIYAGCSAVVPMIFAITKGGIPLGTSLAFMMSIAGLSLPEAIILKRVMAIKLLAAFFAVVAIGIVIIGFLFNALA